MEGSRYYTIVKGIYQVEAYAKCSGSAYEAAIVIHLASRMMAEPFRCQTRAASSHQYAAPPTPGFPCRIPQRPALHGEQDSYITRVLRDSAHLCLPR